MVLQKLLLHRLFWDSSSFLFIQTPGFLKFLELVFLVEHFSLINLGILISKEYFNLWTKINSTIDQTIKNL